MQNYVTHARIERIIFYVEYVHGITEQSIQDNGERARMYVLKR